MTLDTQAISKIAKLARIKVTEEEKIVYSGALNGILQWMEQLNEVNTDGVPLLASVSSVTLPRRKDVVSEGNQQEAILKNATNADYGCFSVPKVIE